MNFLFVKSLFEIRYYKSVIVIILWIIIINNISLFEFFIPEFIWNHKILKWYVKFCYERNKSPLPILIFNFIYESKFYHIWDIFEVVHFIGMASINIWEIFLMRSAAFVLNSIRALRNWIEHKIKIIKFIQKTKNLRNISYNKIDLELINRYEENKKD